MQFSQLSFSIDTINRVHNNEWAVGLDIGSQTYESVPALSINPLAVAGAGVSVQLKNGKVEAARVALSSVAPTPLFVDNAGNELFVM